ncbi:hypothetical protein Taro_009982 [Colocasia esculenta]|uniref:MCM9 N-terminal domain-containing protein n=1 Tax=Colocasia esculenta TaxID=4460 RepID=A0A843U759_COLES|nr:hypothetical protein [Colocasia esculenta]
MRGSSGGGYGEGVHPSPSPSDLVQAFARFLIRRHSPELRSILFSPDPSLPYPLVVDFAELLEFDPPLAHLLFSQPGTLLPLFDQAAQLSQGVVLDGSKELKSEASIKEFVHVRIDVTGSPLECPETFASIGRLRVKHLGFLLTVKGTVIRCGAVKMIEGERVSYLPQESPSQVTPSFLKSQPFHFSQLR